MAAALSQSQRKKRELQMKKLQHIAAPAAAAKAAQDAYTHGFEARFYQLLCLHATAIATRSPG